MVMFTANLMTESISMGLWAVLMWGFVARVDSVPRAAWIGFVAATAILVRPISIIWLPVLAAPMLRPGSRDGRSIVALATGPLLLVGSWTARNYAVFGTFVWSSTNLGVHNAPDFGIPWSRLTVLRHTGLDEVHADRALTREVLRAAAAAPVQTLRTLGQRVVDLFSVSTENCWELAFARSRVFAASPPGLFLLDASIAILRVQHVLAVLGAAAAARNPRLRERRLLIPLVAFVVLQCILSRGDVRFVAPAIPMLCIFAAGVVRRA